MIGASRNATEPDLACDLLDPASLRRAVRSAQPELVVNLAGTASVGRSWSAPAETFAVNATGGLNLLDAVAEEAPSAHLTFVSSAEVYAPAERRPAEVDLMVADPSRARRELDWKPKVGFEELVRMMVDADLELLSRERAAADAAPRLANAPEPG